MFNYFQYIFHFPLFLDFAVFCIININHWFIYISIYNLKFHIFYYPRNKKIIKIKTRRWHKIFLTALHTCYHRSLIFTVFYAWFFVCVCVFLSPQCFFFHFTLIPPIFIDDMSHRSGSTHAHFLVVPMHAHTFPHHSSQSNPMVFFLIFLAFCWNFDWLGSIPDFAFSTKMNRTANFLNLWNKALVFFVLWVFFEMKILTRNRNLIKRTCCETIQRRSNLTCKITPKGLPNFLLSFGWRWTFL